MSKSSSFFSELASAMRISTLPTRASSLASGVCSDAMARCDVMGLSYEGAGQQTRVLWQAQQADTDGVAHGRQEDWMTKRCSVVVYWASPSVIATCGVGHSQRQGWAHGYRDDAVAPACNNRIASSTCFCPRRRLLPLCHSYNTARLAIRRPPSPSHCLRPPPRRVPASTPEPRLSQAVDRTCNHTGTRRP